MDHRSFDDWTRQACARGQARLAALTAGAVAELDPALTRALADAGPEPYLEPVPRRRALEASLRFCRAVRRRPANQDEPRRR